eukprot:1158302-Pelagomonas_calceolata.AAC.4
MYQNECMRIAKFCKRLVPLFEDIEEDASTIQGAALARSHSRMKVRQSVYWMNHKSLRLQKCHGQDSFNADLLRRAPVAWQQAGSRIIISNHLGPNIRQHAAKEQRTLFDTRMQQAEAPEGDGPAEAPEGNGPIAMACTRRAVLWARQV